jgi:hypothetical protein
MIYEGQLFYFLQDHFPVILRNPGFVLVVLAMSGILFAAAYKARSRAALIAGFCNLMYLVPFVRL